MSETCALCNRPINPYDAGTWKEVVGFVGGPKKDSMRLRHDTGRHAHNACVARQVAGQAVDQPELLSVPESDYVDLTGQDVADIEEILGEE